MSKKNRLTLLVFAVLVVVAFSLRLYKIDNTLTEWFSWRQSDTAAVGRFLIKDGFNFLKPKYYDLSNIQSGLDNPEGLRFVEFPLYSGVFASLYRFIGIFPLEVWARFTTAILSIISLAVVYYLLKKEYGQLEAFFGALFFAVAPYVVYYSRSILPDMPAISLTMVAIFFFYRYVKGRAYNFLLSAVFFALALLVKPVVIFYFLVIFYLLLKKNIRSYKKIVLLAIFSLITFLPLILWRLYITEFPEGIPASQWLLTAVNTGGGLQTVFFRPAFFRWIFFERINNLILGGYLTVFTVLGIFSNSNSGKSKIPLHIVFLVASLFYLFTFQGGNVQHDYYQIIITPAIAILVGVGIGDFIRRKNYGSLFLRIIGITVIFALSVFFSYYQIKDYYLQNNDQILVADVIRSLTKPNDILVTDTTGDTTLLYLSDRRGYPAPYKSFPELKKQGADYFITADLSYKEKLESSHHLIFENDKVLIFKL
jgi:hypothetical protein